MEKTVATKRVEEAIKCFEELEGKKPHRIRAPLEFLQKLGGEKYKKFDAPLKILGVQTLADHRMNKEYFVLEHEEYWFRIVPEL